MYPAETACRSAAADGAVAELLAARRVPLGGVRGIEVDRVLPQRTLPTVGAWCFLDSFDSAAGGMRVLPHPHIGLQTVTWTFAGRIRHRDSLGSDVVIRPGQLDLMTAGRGIAHSEFSTGDPGGLHGLQLWVALPAGDAAIAPGFEQHTELPTGTTDGIHARVLVGSLAGVTSPATTYTPLVGAQLDVPDGTVAELPLRPDFEHAVLVIDGTLEVAGTTVTTGPLLYLGTGRDTLALSSPGGATAMLIGGEPPGDDLVIWWNFVGRNHEEIVAARADWEGRTGRFGRVAGHGDARIPAPRLPNLRLTARRRGGATPGRSG